MQMYFLRKIYALIHDHHARQELEQWAQIYKGGPFEVVIRSAFDTPGDLVEGKERMVPEEEDLFIAKEEAVLWITDSSSLAKRLTFQRVGIAAFENTELSRCKRNAVLAYLHERNSGEDFGCCRYAMLHPLELDAEYFELIYRRLKRLPWDILETERCTLRESTVADVPAFYEIYKEPSITTYMENLFPTPEEENDYMEDYIDKVYAYYDFGVWTVLEKATRQVIGRAGLSYREGFTEPELGFVIGVPWQGQGLAYEVCSGVLDYGRRVLDFERVQALVEPGNKASLALCRKLGFEEVEPLTLEGREYIRLVIVL